MIRYLENGEKYRSRQLWRETFEEDSESFLDYYYKEKTKDNRILVKEVNNRIVSMIHRNPYWIAAKDLRWECSYLVGVATAKDCRKQGYMRQLMEKSLTDMYREGMPFSFLKPAYQELYEPFGFTYVFQKREIKLIPEAEVTLSRKSFEKELEENVARWMEAWLARNYEVYTVRTGEYVQRLLQELESENGFMKLLYEESRMVGVEAEWGIWQREQRMLLCESEFCQECGSKTPCIMARIVNLPIFIQAIRLHQEVREEEKTVILKVTDSVIPENAGVWKWKLQKDGSYLMRIPCGEKLVKIDAEMDIQEMTFWLFGYSVPESAGELKDWVRPLRGVFLDEIV